MTASRKLCLNLFSRKFLKLRLSLVRNLILFELSPSNKLFTAGLMKIATIAKARIQFVPFDSRRGEKNEFLKMLCLKLKSGILFMFLVPYVEVLVGIRLRRKGDCLFIKIYKRNTNSQYQRQN